LASKDNSGPLGLSPVDLMRQLAQLERRHGRLARRFAQRLHGRFGIKVELVDEHLTSHDAEQSLRSAGARGAKLKAALDPVAAQRILETFFESLIRDP